MKAISKEEAIALANGRGFTTAAVKAARLIRDFMEAGYEAAIIDAEDFGMEKFTKTQPGYLAKKCNEQAKALGLEEMFRACGHKNTITFVRLDI